MLPEVIRYNGEIVGDWYHELWRDVAHTPLGMHFASDNPCHSLAEYVRHLIGQAGLKTELEQLDVSEGAIEQLAEEATKQWTGNFNPRPVSQEIFRELYARTFSTASEAPE
jgi:alcohol dehydrogenase